MPSKTLLIAALITLASALPTLVGNFEVRQDTEILRNEMIMDAMHSRSTPEHQGGTNVYDAASPDRFLHLPRPIDSYRPARKSQEDPRDTVISADESALPNKQTNQIRGLDLLTW